MLADRDGRYLWVGDTSGGYYSEDNGTSWTRMGNYPGNGGVAFVDGWVFAQDEESRLYSAVLDDNHVDIVRSSNGGDSWDQTTYLAGVSGTADRPWIAAQGDEVVLFYFDAPAVITGLYEHCARSTDGGLTWLDRDPMAGSPQGGNAVFDDQGNFYYGDNSGTVYKFAGSCTSSVATRAMFGSSVRSSNNMIPVAVEGEHLCMAAATTGNGAIQLSCLRDFGVPKVRTISPEFLKANIFSTISMQEGQIAVAWYGSETDGDPTAEGFTGAFNVYVAIVEDFWEETATITHHRLTSTPNHVGQICIGGISCTETSDRDLLDYFGIDHDIWGNVHVAYAHDGTTANAQTRHARLLVDAMAPGGGPVVVDPNAPIADFSHRIAGYDVAVDASDSFDPLGSGLAYTWDWGDGDAGSGVEATHSYSSYGAFSIRLTVEASDGRTGSTVANVLVDGTTSNDGPHAEFSISPSRPEAGQKVRFEDRSEDDGSIIARAWSFGDGTTSTVKDPSHTYVEPGNYTVILEVTDDTGATDLFGGTLRVFPVGQGGGTEASTSFADRLTPMPGLAWLVAALAGAAVVARRHA
jgi:PKD repeat protein